ncbi:MAG: 5-bromo-4-chloroindolyl phosphate hydrolysis family protein [bacterium]
MAHQVVNRRPHPGPGIKGILLGFFAAALLPVAIASLFKGDLIELLLSSSAFVLIALAAWLTRRGIVATQRYQQRSLASAPPPYRLIGLFCASAASFLVAWGLNDYSMLDALVFALVAALGYFLYYDLDPRHDKVFQPLPGYSTEELVDIISEAQARIDEIERQRSRIANPALDARLETIVGLAEDILKILEKKPKELRRARKFMNVYLDSAREVTVNYANVRDKTRDSQLHANFEDVLATIEKSFSEQREKLLSNDIYDLDIQIEVLKRQLEG